MEELVQNLVDDTDENLEASGEVVIPTSSQKQETHNLKASGEVVMPTG